MEVLDSNPFRRTSEELFWGRLSNASSFWLDTLPPNTEQRQPSETDRDIEAKRQLLSKVHRKAESGIRVGPFMGVEHPPHSQRRKDSEDCSPLLWNKEVQAKGDTSKKRKEIATVDVVDGQLAKRARFQGYLTSVSQCQSPKASEWCLDDMDWLPDELKDMEFDFSAPPEVPQPESFHDIVHWTQDWIADVEGTEGNPSR